MSSIQYDYNILKLYLIKFMCVCASSYWFILDAIVAEHLTSSGRSRRLQLLFGGLRANRYRVWCPVAFPEVQASKGLYWWWMFMDFRG